MAADGDTGRTNPSGVVRHRSRRPRSRSAGALGSRGAATAVRVRDWRVRSKLGAVLAIPAVAFLVVVGLQATFSFQQAAALNELADRAALSQQVAALVHELQFERDWAAGQLASVTATGSSTDTAELAEQMAPALAAATQAAADFQAAAAPLRDRPALAQPIAASTAALAELDAVRAGMLTGWLRQGAVFDGYTRAIEALQALLPAGATTDSSQLRGHPELAALKELTAQRRGQVHAVVSAGGPRAADAARLADLRAQRSAALSRFRAAATPAQAARFDDAVRGQAVRAAARLEQAVLEGQEVAAQQWWSAASTELELFREVELALLAEAVAAATEAGQAQLRRTATVTAVALLTILVSLLLSVVIGQSMIRSLRALRLQAVTVAHQSLPGLLDRLRASHSAETIPEPPLASAASSKDEIGEVAEAFTQVHRSAVRLAVEQAQMRHNVNKIFVNLARRSQILVERQLELLDELERDETDATQLASLFRLDHLATRMRRNNDSVLVLTDSDPIRRHHRPVQLASVALAAVAEIERYQRVRDDVAPSLYVAPHAAGDLVHLLAELLDNATSFSDPDSTVMLTGQALSATAGALVEITDTGIGMSTSALQEANDLLADPPMIDVAASVRMGLVVVGHLAARHGIEVQLSQSPPGLTATVWLPPGLLAPAPTGDDPDSPATIARSLPPGGARPRRTPVRAEDVLGEAHAAQEPASVWWSRSGDQPPAPAPAMPAPAAAAPTTSLPAAPAAATPAATANPATVSHAAARSVPRQRTNASGLPVRVPMAQLPSTALALPQPAPARSAPSRPDGDLDPDELGGTLAQLYRGIRRAEAEPPPAQPARARQPAGQSGPAGRATAQPARARQPAAPLPGQPGQPPDWPPTATGQT